jgi:signal transduction histidine kinase
MDMEDNKSSASPQRADTDQSLRKERHNSDQEVRRQNSLNSEVADAAIGEARDEADEALRATRDADDPRPTKAESDARGEEDAAIEDARTVADQQLASERSARTRELAEFFALERDLTDRHLLKERERADLALNSRDDFLGMVAHDLRNFMSDIVLRAAALIRKSAEDEAGRSARQVGLAIQRSTAAMNRLVSDLLDVAAIEAGRLQIDAAVGDVASVLRDAAEPFRFAAQAKGIFVELEDTPVTVTAKFDHDRVMQVLGNLVSNAMKFTPSGGKIRLGLSVIGEEVQLTVADTGSGIPADKLETIFDRFIQLQPTDRRGLGLGLYISKCLIEGHGGRIWASSVVGQGSSLCFTLPLAQ